jgi:phosphoadenosine phosphosulfate reductase
MSRDVPDYLDVDYADGAGESAADYPTLDDKLAKAVAVTETALSQYRAPAVLWTGGKDSTLVLYLVREVAAELGVDVPPVVFIDHFEHFPEVEAFVERWTEEWDLDLVVARNDEIAALDAAPGDEIDVADLSATTRRELDRLEFEGDSFVLDADTLVGNHLLKTVVLNETLEARGFDAVFSGVRWDEQAARADETFFSPRHESEKYPPHDRVHPILQFDERADWDATWRVVVPDTVEGFPAGHVPQHSDDLPADLAVEDLPVGPKYFEGFRSLGTESGSARGEDRPAWRQNLDETGEREGRAQDKEDLMARLRDLGYM